MPDPTMQAWKPLPFEEASAFWSSRVPMTPREFDKLAAAVRGHAFQVAGLAKQAQVDQVFEAMGAAIRKGTTIDQFRKDIAAIIEKKGWTGPARWRVDTIFRTNIQTAYNVGKYVQQQRAIKDVPFGMYDAVNDSRTRPTHAALDGKVVPLDDPFWDTWMPPNGFCCRCTRRALSAAEVRARGLKVEEGSDLMGMPVDVGDGRVQVLLPDPGFDTNPGKDFMEAMAG